MTVNCIFQSLPSNYFKGLTPLHKVKMRKSCSLNIRKFLIFFCCSLVHAGKKMNFTSLHCFISWTFLQELKKKMIQFRVYLKTFCLIKIISCNKSELIPLAAKKSRNSTDLFSVLFTDFNLVRKWDLLKIVYQKVVCLICLHTQQ